MMYHHIVVITENSKYLLAVLLISLLMVGCATTSEENSTRKIDKNYSTSSAEILLRRSKNRLNATEPTKPVALLIGIGDYNDPLINDLDGPPYDVEALYDTLVDWGIPDSNIMSLVNQEATRENILSAIDLLSGKTDDDGYVLIYFSGHGTSAWDYGNTNLDPKKYRNTGALVPANFPMGGDRNTLKRRQLDNLIVGSRDLRDRFERLDQSGRRVFVVFDACYSGDSVRMYNGRAFPTRLIKPPITFSEDFPSDQVLDTSDDAPYPYKNIVYFSASNKKEEAIDISRVHLGSQKTVDNKPHGAFTNALLRILKNPQKYNQNNDSQLSYKELYNGISSVMEEEKYFHTPGILPRANQDTKRLVEGAVFEANNLLSHTKPASGTPTIQRPTREKALMKKSKINLNLDFDSVSTINLPKDSTLEFNIKGTKPFYLLLLRVNSKSDVEILYPRRVKQMRKVPSDLPVRFSGTRRILVSPPYGEEHYIAYGFVNPLSNKIEQWVKKKIFDLGKVQFDSLIDILEEQASKYDVAIRTIETVQ